MSRPFLIRSKLGRLLRQSSGILAALLMLVPCAMLRAGDGVGVDGLIGSLPQRRGPNGEIFFNGLAASFVPGAGSYWGQLPTTSSLIAFEGDENSIRSSITQIRRDTGRTRLRLTDRSVAFALGCDVDVTVDFQALAAAGVHTFLQLPATYAITTASSASTTGFLLSAPVSAAARHYYFNLQFIVATMGQFGLPDVEIYFVDPHANLMRARFTLEPGSYLRIQVY